ncbi:glutamine synthetase family protein [Schaalia suimastitidis]|uniref:glutamine synthetase family protein n=1 Tax=Schaalia suimastitidis TaxID=121163 RepID=UPI00042A281C|nr:glutamine synthetase family protein [Schaalia suimastitidis]
MDRQQERVLREVADKGIRFIRLWFTDVAGQLKSVAMDPGELEDAFGEGIGFDGSAIEGLTRVHESDMLLRPDASTFQILPSRGGHEPVGRMFCDVHTPDGSPSLSDPRATLERTLEKARDMGFTAMVHPEIEFYLLSKPVNPTRLVPIDDGRYFDHVARGTDNDFRRKLVRALEDTGISVEFSHHEDGPGQNEIDLRAVDALAAADNIMTARVIIEEVALEEDMVATFMPKPFIDHQGSGMHTHISLFEGDHNAFYDPAGQHQLSATGRHFIAGLLAHASSIAAVTNQHVNSYKRLWAGRGEAPSFVCWGHNNSTVLVRVPLYKPNKRNASRIEYRALDPAANPYLALSLLLAAGLDGIERRLELMPEAEDNVWALSDRERHVLGIEPLPHSLHDAVRVMRSSELVAATLGEEMFAHVLRDKEREWRAYREQITAQEIAQFIRMY